MSLDLLKKKFNVKSSAENTEEDIKQKQKYVEKFNDKPLVIEYQKELENKQEIIEKLEKESNDLTNEIINLEKERNSLSQRLNEANHFEEGVLLKVLTDKENDYNNEIKSKDNIINDVKIKSDLLYKKIDKQKNKISYKNKAIDNSLNIIKDSKYKMDILETKLKSSKNKNKDVVENLNLKIKKLYKEYVSKIDLYENEIKSKNQITEEKKQESIKTLEKLKKINDDFDNLLLKNNKNKEIISKLNYKIEENKQIYLSKNDSFKDRIQSKDDIISELKGEIENLSTEIITLSENINNLESDNINNKKMIKELNYKIIENENLYLLENKKFKNKIKSKDNIILELQGKGENHSADASALSETISQLELDKDKYKKMIKELNYKIIENENLYLSDNENLEDEIKLKDYSILGLNEKIDNLSNKVTALSNNAYEKSILEKKLVVAEKFNEIVDDEIGKYKSVINESFRNDINPQSLIYMLGEIIRNKQGTKVLDWQQWLMIPESKYLTELSEGIARKIFNDNNAILKRNMGMGTRAGDITSKITFQTTGVGGTGGQAGLVYTIKEKSASDTGDGNTILNLTILGGITTTKTLKFNADKIYTWSIAKGDGSGYLYNKVTMTGDVSPSISDSTASSGIFESITGNFNINGVKKRRIG